MEGKDQNAVSPLEVEMNHIQPSQEIVAGLEERGHITKETESAGSVAGAILRSGDRLQAKADFRKSGGVDGI